MLDRKWDFSDFIEDDMIKLYDILNIPDHIPGYILKRKIVLIVKKETNNLDRTIRMIVQTYPNLSDRKILIIDDEADFASIGFKKGCDRNVELRKIASQIDELRKKVKKSDYLEVTATPYSLYLQPEDTAIPTNDGNYCFAPQRPAFTVLLPVYNGYIGGDFLFIESKNEQSIAHFVYKETPVEELDALKKENRKVFKIEDCLTHKRVRVLREGILNFIIGACIRRIQQEKSGKRKEKYSFVVHTEQGKEAHDWQVEVVAKINELLIYCAEHNLPMLSELVSESL
jgi:hypothetical protein